MADSTDFTSIAERLGRDGACIWPQFLDLELLDEARADLECISSDRGFNRAGTGQGLDRVVGEVVRRDEVHWIDRDSSSPFQLKLWAKLDALKQALNRTLYLGISEFEGHYSAYPVGGFYKRHLDRFQKDHSRIVSVVIYLNPDWTSKDGGELRIYGADSHLDIAPLDGTLVCFLSGESEHEVLVTHARRLSFTGWFKRNN